MEGLGADVARLAFRVVRARLDGCNDTGATLDDLREAVTTLDETERTARRVLGGAHPVTVDIAKSLREARAALRARETPPPGEST